MGACCAGIPGLTKWSFFWTLPFHQTYQKYHDILREKLIQILIYIDDTFLCATTDIELQRNIQITLDVFRSCGFTINLKKSHLKPTTRLEFLGFLIDSCEYSIQLLQSKREKIHKFSKYILNSKCISIRKLAKLIGLYISTFPASDEAPLHYRHLERWKIKMLKNNNDKWEKLIHLDTLSRHEIKWCIRWIFSDKFKKSLHPIVFNRKLVTDSSKNGWGSSLDFDERRTASGKCLPHQMDNSINTKELMAIFYGLKSFRRQLTNANLMIFTDNTTSLSCLNKKGSQHLFRDQITRGIFKIALKHNIRLSRNFIPGILNQIADRSSRSYNFDRMANSRLCNKNN